MALNKEIWVNDIKEMLLPDNSFVTKGIDYSTFADNKTIHIPVETGKVNVEVDRTTLPGSVTTTTEAENFITMHHFTTDPQRVFRPGDIELSYDKRRLISKKIADGLNDKIAEYALGILAQIGGDTIAANAKVLDKLSAAALAFDQADYPDQERYVLLSASSYSKLLNELTESQTNAFLNVANASTGIVGSVFGLNILKRSSLGTGVDYIKWHKTDYMFALGGIEIYTQENAPEYYGTILSASARFGAYIPETGETTGD